MTRPAEDSTYLRNQSKGCELFCSPLDDSNDTRDTAQLLTIIRSIKEAFVVVEELSSLESLHGTTTGEDLFLSVCEIVKELELPWTKLKQVKTDGPPKYDWK